MSDIFRHLLIPLVLLLPSCVTTHWTSAEDRQSVTVVLGAPGKVSFPDGTTIEPETKPMHVLGEVAKVAVVVGGVMLGSSL